MVWAGGKRKRCRARAAWGCPCSARAPRWLSTPRGRARADRAVGVGVSAFRGTRRTTSRASELATKHAIKWLRLGGEVYIFTVIRGHVCGGEHTGRALLRHFTDEKQSFSLRNGALLHKFHIPSAVYDAMRCLEGGYLLAARCGRAKR